MAVSIDFL
jgi:hypothetical protein